MELETADAVLADEAAHAFDGLDGLVRVDRPERDQHVGVLRRGVGDLETGQRRMTESGGGVDGEDHRRHREAAVMLGEPLDRRTAIGGRLEVLGGRVEQLLVERQAAVAVLFDVDVHVDGDE